VGDDRAGGGFQRHSRRDVVGELLWEGYTLAQFSPRHDVSSGLILHWKKTLQEAGLTEGRRRVGGGLWRALRSWRMVAS